MVELSQETVGSEDKLYKQDEVFSILITEEWLIKLGFTAHKLYDAWYQYSIGKVLHKHRIQTDGETFIFLGYDDGVEIKSVHQIQNLYYALTGEELTISEPTKQSEG